MFYEGGPKSGNVLNVGEKSSPGNVIFMVSKGESTVQDDTKGFYLCGDGYRGGVS